MLRYGRRMGRCVSVAISQRLGKIKGVQIYIKDVKSSNGTFINGERLSPESVESEPFELKSDDIVVRRASYLKCF
jgi:pSer/pThr/pTyr-binding forkhead associated (FHA) protein